MGLTIRKGLGLFGAGLVALPLAVALPAAYPSPKANSAEAQNDAQQEPSDKADDAQEAGTKQQSRDREGSSSAQSQSAPADNGDRDRVVQLEAIPGIDRRVAASSRSGAKSEQNTKSNADDPPLRVEIPLDRFRTTSIFPLAGREITVKALPVTPDGRQTFICKGGTNIVSRSPTFGVIDVEADEIAIIRGPSEAKRRQADHGDTWVDDDKLPMEMHFKGNVVLRHDRDGVGQTSERRVILAAELDYDFVNDQLSATEAEILTSTIVASRIKLFRFLTQQRDHSPPAR
jgi:hypothetical protein